MQSEIGSWPNRPPKPHQLIALIRAMVEAKVRVTISNHAEERMWERDIGMRDILNGWRMGDIVGPVTPGDNPGEWECRVVTRVNRVPENRRELGIVTVVIGTDRLLIGTVRWEDE